MRVLPLLPCACACNTHACATHKLMQATQCRAHRAAALWAFRLCVRPPTSHDPSNGRSLHRKQWHHATETNVRRGSASAVGMHSRAATPCFYAPYAPKPFSSQIAKKSRLSAAGLGAMHQRLGHWGKSPAANAVEHIVPASFSHTNQACQMVILSQLPTRAGSAICLRRT